LSFKYPSFSIRPQDVGQHQNMEKYIGVFL
jgi:hypothetical protein